MTKKSQAAMEFLMTYGWAILVVLVAISALAYFGVLDPSKWLVSSQCTLPTGLSCLDHRIYVQGAANRLELHLKNNLGTQITVTSIDIAAFNNKNSPQSKLLNNGDVTSPNILVTDLTNVGGVPPGTLMPSGTKYDFDFTLTYTNQDSQLPHTVSGHLKGKVN
jgi:hypothetical protein